MEYFLGWRCTVQLSGRQLAKLKGGAGFHPQHCGGGRDKRWRRERRESGREEISSNKDSSAGTGNRWVPSGPRKHREVRDKTGNLADPPTPTQSVPCAEHSGKPLRSGSRDTKKINHPGAF